MNEQRKNTPKIHATPIHRNHQKSFCKPVCFLNRFLGGRDWMSGEGGVRGEVKSWLPDLAQEQVSSDWMPASDSTPWQSKGRRRAVEGRHEPPKWRQAGQPLSKFMRKDKCSQHSLQTRTHWYLTSATLVLRELDVMHWGGIKLGDLPEGGESRVWFWQRGKTCAIAESKKF